MMKKGNSFLRGLVIIIVLFLLANIGFVIYTATLNYGLVSETYYSDEIAYQEQIDRLERTDALPEPVLVDYSSDSGISVTFPTLFEPAAIEGTIKLFRPADKRLDRRFPIILNREGSQSIPAFNLPAKGLWKVKIYWKAEGIEYYLEQEIVAG